MQHTTTQKPRMPARIAGRRLAHRPSGRQPVSAYASSLLTKANGLSHRMDAMSKLRRRSLFCAFATRRSRLRGVAHRRLARLIGATIELFNRLLALCFYQRQIASAPRTLTATPGDLFARSKSGRGCWREWGELAPRLTRKLGRSRFAHKHTIRSTSRGLESKSQNRARSHARAFHA